jgi:hypothetical protein
MTCSANLKRDFMWADNYRGLRSYLLRLDFCIETMKNIRGFELIKKVVVR